MGKAKRMKSAVKKRSPKPSKSSGGVVSAVASKAKAMFGGSGAGRSGKKKKKSAYWYAREIQRLKLKRRYEKARIGVSFK